MLVTCQSCAQPISDKAAACPKCKASGDEAFGQPVPCFECGSPFRASMQSCENCGAPVVVALGKLTADEVARLPTLKNMPWTSKTDEVAADIRGHRPHHSEAHPAPPLAEIAVSVPIEPPSPKAQVIAQTPGFARGKFGRVMAYPLFIIGVLLTMISIGEWYYSSQYTQTPAYAVGRAMAPAIMAFAAVRALIRRSHRSLMDWFLAFFLLLVFAAGLFTLVSTVASPTFSINGFSLLLLAISAILTLASFVVMVRLLRQPYYIRGEDADGERPRLA